MSRFSWVSALCASLFVFFGSAGMAHASAQDLIESLPDDAVGRAVAEQVEMLDDGVVDDAFMDGYLDGLRETQELNQEFDPNAKAASGDGCTWSPDRWGAANFRPACDRHDACYGPNSLSSRKVCDDQFYVQLQNVCIATYRDQAVQKNACLGVALAYYQAVRQFGASHYQGKGQNN
ncbi:hypothetical protein I6E37_00215 [Schaalia hyovaginalis]|nr:hypothetical protein [Schaalia hyovaginalis]